MGQERFRLPAGRVLDATHDKVHVLGLLFVWYCYRHHIVWHMCFHVHIFVISFNCCRGHRFYYQQSEHGLHLSTCQRHDFLIGTINDVTSVMTPGVNMTCSGGFLSTRIMMIRGNMGYGVQCGVHRLLQPHLTAKLLKGECEPLQWT